MSSGAYVASCSRRLDCQRAWRSGVGTILLGALVGAPAYLNGYAAVPLVTRRYNRHERRCSHEFHARWWGRCILRHCGAPVKPRSCRIYRLWRYWRDSLRAHLANVRMQKPLKSARRSGPARLSLVRNASMPSLAYRLYVTQRRVIVSSIT